MILKYLNKFYLQFTMKRKVTFLATAILGVALFTSSLTSCDHTKDKESSSIQASVTHANAEQGVTSEEDFEKVFETTLQMVDATNHLEVRSVEGGYTIQLLEGSGPTTAEKTKVCSWDGGILGTKAFANCCYDWAKAHNCITVTVDHGNWSGWSCD